MCKYWFIVSFIISTFLFAQESFEIEYEEVSIPRLLDKNGNDEKLSDDMIEALSVPKNYLLQVKGNKSVFAKIERINNSQSSGSVTMYGIFSRNVLLDFDQNIQKIEWEIESKKYIVIDTISARYQFNLTREKSTLLGFNVKQATFVNNDYKTIIWYSSDLPNRFGPKDFVNLPGLVLSVESYYKDEPKPRYTLKALSIKENEKLVFKNLFKAKEVSKYEFEKLKNEYNNKMSNDALGVDKE
jgi:GLPGLI family protein